MNPIKTLWCRIFQLAFRAALPILPYREPKILSSVSEVRAILKKETITSALIVTDAGIIRNGLTVSLEQSLSACGIAYTVYSGTQPNPTVDNVEVALLQYRRAGCRAIIAVGGGSAMDCAKAVGARAVYPKRSLRSLGGILKVWKRLPTLIAIPTTAGTGSETTVAALITDPQAKHKYALMSFPLIPHWAVLDPALTESLPPHLTSTTGMDALTHAVEAYIGRSTTRQTRAYAEEAVAVIFANITAVYRDGHDLAAREKMLHASYKAGAAFTKSYVGYIHAIAHALGGSYGVPHGLANAVIMPYVLESYGPCVHKKLHRLAVCAGAASENDPASVGAAKFIAAIRALNTEMGIPAHIAGICPEDIPSLARHAAKEANPLYPVPRLMDAAELKQYFYMVGDINEKH